MAAVVVNFGNCHGDGIDYKDYSICPVLYRKTFTNTYSNDKKQNLTALNKVTFTLHIWMTFKICFLKDSSHVSIAVKLVFVVTS